MYYLNLLAYTNKGSVYDISTEKQAEVISLLDHVYREVNLQRAQHRYVEFMHVNPRRGTQNGVQPFSLLGRILLPLSDDEIFRMKLYLLDWDLYTIETHDSTKHPKNCIIAENAYKKDHILYAGMEFRI